MRTASRRPGSGALEVRRAMQEGQAGSVALSLAEKVLGSDLKLTGSEKG